MCAKRRFARATNFGKSQLRQIYQYVHFLRLVPAYVPFNVKIIKKTPVKKAQKKYTYQYNRCTFYTVTISLPYENVNKKLPFFKIYHFLTPKYVRFRQTLTKICEFLSRFFSFLLKIYTYYTIRWSFWEIKNAERPPDMP